VLKTKPNAGRIHVLKGDSGHAEDPTMTVCGKDRAYLKEMEELYASRSFLTPETQEKACLACKTWVRNGAPYYHND
jgi:hypothetical protein